MREIVLEMLNCFGRKNDKLEMVLTDVIQCDSTNELTKLLELFQNILIFPLNENLKLLGRLKDIHFSNAEREEMLKRYNSEKLKDCIEKEKYGKFFEENEELAEWILANEFEKIDIDEDEEEEDVEDACLKKDEMPIELQNIIDKFEKIIDGKISVYQMEKGYSISINTYKLSFANAELDIFINILNQLRQEKVLIIPRYDYANEENQDCIGVVVDIMISKEFINSKAKA